MSASDITAFTPKPADNTELFDAIQRLRDALICRRCGHRNLRHTCSLSPLGPRFPDGSNIGLGGCLSCDCHEFSHDGLPATTA